MNKYILINKRNEGKPCGIYENFLYAFSAMCDNIINDILCLRNYCNNISNKQSDEKIFKNYYISHMIDNSNINCDIYELEYENSEFKIISQFDYDKKIILSDNKETVINNRLSLLNDTYQDLFNDNESMNCFIPKELLNTEGDIPMTPEKNNEYPGIDTLCNTSKLLNIDYIKDKIKYLEQQKENKEFELNLTEQELNDKLYEYTDDKMELEEKKKILKEDQDKWNEFKRKFEVDKNLYFTFKDEMNSGERKKDDIPELFKSQYKIFSKLDCENILNTENELNDYIDLMPMIKKNNLNFIPKDDSYNSMFANDDHFLGKLKENMV
jgi:hypothetical protein